MAQEKTDKELSAINTKNLLAYYKAERKRYWSLYRSYVCDCCGEIIGSKEQIKEAEEKIEAKGKYLKRIKDILSTREHLQK